MSAARPSPNTAALPLRRRNTCKTAPATHLEPTEPLAQGGWSPPIDGHGLFKSLMLRLPQRVRRSLDHEQLLAIRQAAEEMAWGEHPLDVRLSLPFLGRRHYLVLIGGKERRDPLRRRGERLRHPLVRVGNIASGLAFVVLLTLAGIFVGLVARTVMLV